MKKFPWAQFIILWILATDLQVQEKLKAAPLPYEIQGTLISQAWRLCLTNLSLWCYELCILDFFYITDESCVKPPMAAPQANGGKVQNSRLTMTEPFDSL